MKTPSVEESQRGFIVWNDAKSVSLEKCTEKCYEYGVKISGKCYEKCDRGIG